MDPLQKTATVLPPHLPVAVAAASTAVAFGSTCRPGGRSYGQSSPPLAPLPLPGHAISPGASFEATYDKGSILGRGASGVAFVVRPRKDPKVEYVAKEICLMRCEEKRRREAFAESRLLRELRHDHIVTCLDVFEEMDMLYIVMEYATGGDLGRRIQARKTEGVRFTEAVIMRVFAQVSSALHYIHSQKIVHRDLKPANIFIAGEGDLSCCTVKLGDFGIAKMVEGTMGQANSTVGTPSYLSPEICKNNPYGVKADVWSLGVVLYEMSCLKVPFQASNLPAMALQICTMDFKPLPEDFSSDLHALVNQLLQKDPLRRPAMSAVVEEPFVKAFMAEFPETSSLPSGGWLPPKLPGIEAEMLEGEGSSSGFHEIDWDHRRRKRRGRPPFIDGQEPDGGYVRSPARYAHRRREEAQSSPESHGAMPLPSTSVFTRPGARSVSPTGSNSVPVPAGMRTSGSAPSLPPLPPLMAQSRRGRISNF